jgi:sucrose-6-phosphate hydrolase SacC (GH32 family)
LGHVAGTNRDPKVIWHAESGRWVMALYLDGAQYALYNSPDLKHWAHLQDVELPGAWECPDFFPLAVDGNVGDERWVFWGANGTYLVGSFDGTTFTPEGAPQRYDWSELTYAAQTWSDIPAEDGRRIQIGWARLTLPGMPFNQMMALPCELSLRATPDGVRLYSRPVRELAGLRHSRLERQGVVLPAGETALDAGPELLEVQAEFEVGEAASFGLTVRGVPISYDVAAAELTVGEVKAGLAPEDGRVRVQVLVDRALAEVFANDGRVAIQLPVLPDPADRAVAAFSRGGPTTLARLAMYELESIWPA